MASRYIGDGNVEEAYGSLVTYEYETRMLTGVLRPVSYETGMMTGIWSLVTRAI